MLSDLFDPFFDRFGEFRAATFLGDGSETFSIIARALDRPPTNPIIGFRHLEVSGDSSTELVAAAFLAPPDDDNECFLGLYLAETSARPPQIVISALESDETEVIPLDGLLTELEGQRRLVFQCEASIEMPADAFSSAIGLPVPVHLGQRFPGSDITGIKYRIRNRRMKGGSIFVEVEGKSLIATLEFQITLSMQRDPFHELWPLLRRTYMASMFARAR
ncbi:MAG: hypothetical protein O3B31_04835 [Chloroflexi bacterium]|nr:hypothetical protein [Chloroflexota bacterium]MDA1002660.1 hypothetical protein [Chloroflexota bacterium]